MIHHITILRQDSCTNGKDSRLALDTRFAMHCHECRLETIMAKTFEQLVPAPAGRFDGISRPYTPAEVEKLRGSVPIAYTLAERGANRLWQSLKTEPFVNSLGAVTGNQAMQQARAGLPAIYLSGWQVAADANTAGAMYPDQSLYPANAGPELCRRINRTFQRADQIEHSEGGAKIDWFVPIVADAEAGFGGPLNSFEIMKAYIEAGAAGVHFEDQLASEKKCGHMGGKVLIPTAAHERNLIAARLAADVCGTPTFVLARTDAESAKLITADVDERDREFIPGERTAAGFYRLKPGTGLAQCKQSIPARCWRTIVRPRSTGKPTSTRPPSQNSSARSARWATNSSLSRWRASTRSTTACSNWRAATRPKAWRLIPACSRPNSRRR